MRVNTTSTIVFALLIIHAPQPALAQQIPPSVHQIDASDYRSAAVLEAGAVLVVGAGQSGGGDADAGPGEGAGHDEECRYTVDRPPVSVGACDVGPQRRHLVVDHERQRRARLDRAWAGSR